MEKGITKAPESVIRLLKLYIDGDASGLLGKEWVQDALFHVPEWRRGFTPHEIRALFWKCQQIVSLENENKLLKQEIERRNEEYNLLEIRADFYKRQIILESRFGLMLQRSFS